MEKILLCIDSLYERNKMKNIHSYLKYMLHETDIVTYFKLFDIINLFLQFVLHHFEFLLAN